MILRRHLLTATAAFAVLAGCDRIAATKPASFSSVDITGADYAKSLSLPDTEGRVRTLADWKGRLVVVFFGFAQCPDVCPTTLAELAAVRNQLGADGAKVQVVFVTLDPERDTAQVLRAYVANFGNDIVALRGTPEQTLAATKDFKVFYAKVPGKTESSYTIDHTAGAFVFDTKGQVRLFVRYGAPPEGLVSDMKTLLGQA
jgi:protein SCO1